MKRLGITLAAILAIIGGTASIERASAAIVTFEYTATALGNAAGSTDGDDWRTVTGTGSYDDAEMNADGLHPLLSFSWDSSADQWDYSCANLATCSNYSLAYPNYFLFDSEAGAPDFVLTDSSAQLFLFFSPQSGTQTDIGCGGYYGAGGSAHWCMTEITLLGGGGGNGEPPDGTGSVSEPATLALLGFGLAGLLRATARRSRGAVANR